LVLNWGDGSVVSPVNRIWGSSVDEAEGIYSLGGSGVLLVSEELLVFISTQVHQVVHTEAEGGIILLVMSLHGVVVVLEDG